MAGTEKFRDAVHAVSRTLSGAPDDFEYAGKMSQIFSGAMFSALVLYLVFSNSTRLSYIQRASLEKRLSICCQINTAVAALSAFLNFFQVTEVDNWILPDQRDQYTVDVARPIEWILTCPLMQLCLVLMGGSRIPEYRRVLMPAFSVVTLLFGASTLFVDPPVTYVLYGLGCCSYACMCFFNRLQILEHSRGVEGLLTGDSEFRKATLILLSTWFPFPMWFILSPEGLGIIDSVVLVQMGWAFLNIIAKFTLAFYIQRIKDNYCNRLKVKREMKGAMERGSTEMDDFIDVFADPGSADSNKPNKVNGELHACVVETMNFLGMAENIDRLVKLLANAKICTLEDIANCTKEQCDTLSLPVDLIQALQKRTKVWKLEMIDDAERGLEAGEKAYEQSERGKTKQKSYVEPDGFNVRPVSAGNRPVWNYGVYGSVAGEDGTTGQVDQPGMVRQVSGSTSPGGTSVANGFNGVNVAGAVAANSWSNVPTFSNLDAFSGSLNQHTPDPSPASTARTVRAPRGYTSHEDLAGLENRILGTIMHALEGMNERQERRHNQLAEKLETGLQEMSKTVERSQTLLEAKVEYVFGQQNQQHESTQTNMQNSLKDIAKEVCARASETCTANASCEKNIQLYLDNMAEKLQESMDLQQKSANSWTQHTQVLADDWAKQVQKMSDDWALQVIQESKAAAFTLQGKVGALEDAQDKKLEGLRASFSEHMRKDLNSAITQIMQEASSQFGTSGTTMHDISQLIEGILPGIEVRIDVLSNTLRSHLENPRYGSQHMSSPSMMSAQPQRSNFTLGADMGDVNTKLDDIAGRMATRYQIEGLNIQGLQQSVEDASRSQKEMLNSVIGEARSAKDSCADCTEKVARLDEKLRFLK